jgi:hypothetical protein
MKNRFFLSIHDRIELAKKPSHATVPLKTYYDNEFRLSISKDPVVTGMPLTPILV